MEGHAAKFDGLLYVKTLSNVEEYSFVLTLKDDVECVDGSTIHLRPRSQKGFPPTNFDETKIVSDPFATSSSSK